MRSRWSGARRGPPLGVTATSWPMWSAAGTTGHAAAQRVGDAGGTLAGGGPLVGQAATSWPLVPLADQRSGARL